MIDQNKLLNAIHIPLKIWLLLIIFIYIFCRSLLPQIYKPVYQPNSYFSTLNWWTELVGVLVTFVTLAIHGGRARDDRGNKVMFFLFISCSVFLLGSIVFLSGGWIDSPFTGPVSLYVGYFLVLQEDLLIDRIYLVFNIALVIFGLGLVLLPYVIMPHDNGQMFILRWEESVHVIWGRLLLNIFLMVVTIGVGQWVGTRVSALRR